MISKMISTLRVTTYVILALLLLLSTSCRRNSYTPADPNSDYEIDRDIEFFYKPQKADIYYLGDSVPIEYRVFSNSDVVDIYVIKKTSVIYQIALRTENDGKFTWNTDLSTRPSVHYQIKIVNPQNTEVFILSESFGVIAN